MNPVVATEFPRPGAPGVLHLVHFDLRRCRLLAATMMAMEVARAAFVEWSLRLAPTRIGGRIAGHFGGTFGTAQVEFLDALLWLATALTTAAIVQSACRPTIGRSGGHARSRRGRWRSPSWPPSRSSSSSCPR